MYFFFKYILDQYERNIQQLALSKNDMENQFQIQGKGSTATSKNQNRIGHPEREPSPLLLEAKTT